MMLLQGVQHLALSDWAGHLPGALLRASSTALLSLAVSDLSTAEGAAAAVASAADPHAPVLHTAGGYRATAPFLLTQEDDIMDLVWQVLKGQLAGCCCRMLSCGYIIGRPVCLPVGVLEDGRLAKQTAGSFRRVAAGKVAGVQALERELSAAPTRGVIAFSSVSSIVAPLGQPNYASANASLCAWASAKAAQGTPVERRLAVESVWLRMPDFNSLSKTCR